MSLGCRLRKDSCRENFRDSRSLFTSDLDASCVLPLNSCAPQLLGPQPTPKPSETEHFAHTTLLGPFDPSTCQLVNLACYPL